MGGEAAEAAFQALVTRHGPMVLDVCGNVLRSTAMPRMPFRRLSWSWHQGRGRSDGGTPLPVGSWGSRGGSHCGPGLMRSDGECMKCGRRRQRPTAWRTRLSLGRNFMRRSAGCRRDTASPSCSVTWRGTEHRGGCSASRLPPGGQSLSRLSRARERLRGGLTRRGLALPAGLLGAVLAPRRHRAVCPRGPDLREQSGHRWNSLKPPASTAVLSSAQLLSLLATGELCAMMVTSADQNSRRDRAGLCPCGRRFTRRGHWREWLAHKGTRSECAESATNQQGGGPTRSSWSDRPAS